MLWVKKKKKKWFNGCICDKMFMVLWSLIICVFNWSKRLLKSLSTNEVSILVVRGQNLFYLWIVVIFYSSSKPHIHSCENTESTYPRTTCTTSRNHSDANILIYFLHFQSREGSFTDAIQIQHKVVIIDTSHLLILSMSVSVIFILNIDNSNLAWRGGGLTFYPS